MMTTRMIGSLFLLALLAGMLAGCEISRRDEARIAEAQARTDTARYQALEAQARADGLSAQANANALIQTTRAQEETKQHAATMAVLPVALLILLVVGGGVAGALLVLWYRGKAHLIVVQAQAATMLPALPSPPRMLSSRAQLPGPVAARAWETGTTAVQVGGAWLLVDDVGEVVEEMRRGR